MSDSGAKKPKIIIDEDWKSQVEREKEELEQVKSQQDAEAERKPGGPLPPANLSMLLSTLATQAMMSMGQIPNPISGKPETDLDQAEHFIDTLGMLEEKTANNRTPEESMLLDRLLHELRLAFVTVSKQASSAPAAPAQSPAESDAAE